jgi:hypothetical protein
MQSIDFSQFDCVDHVVSLRYLLLSNDVRQYRHQCIKCGEVVGKSSIKYSELSEEEKRTAPKFDDRLLHDRREERRRLCGAAFEAQRTERSIEWFAAHNEYLKTPEWKDKQRRVFARDNMQCRAGLPGCTRRAEQAHHLTYDHWQNEPLFDLISVCKHCHDEITRMDRERRSQ